MHRRYLLTLACLLASFTSSIAIGQQIDCDSCDSASAVTAGAQGIFGEQRAMLAESGITFQNNFTQFYFGNTAGGLQREFRYGGHGDYVTNFDFGKLGVQEGLFLKLRAEHRFGESLAGATGSLLPANVAADLPDAGETSLILSNVLITQALSESFILFAGKLDTLDGDVNTYAHGRGIQQFSNMAFVANPIALRTVPYSTLGAGFAYLLDGQPLLTFTVLNTEDTSTTSGFGELFNNGVALTTELRVPTNFLGMPGHQLFAGTWSSRNYVGLDQDPRVILPSVPLARQSGSWSLYYNCDQALFGDAQNQWGYFARAGIADDATNPIAYFLSAGLGGNSPICGREHDRFGLGYYYAATSNELAPFLQVATGPLGDGQGVELFYNAAVNSALSITPDLQFIAPSRDRLNNAVVAGIRANLAF